MIRLQRYLLIIVVFSLGVIIAAQASSQNDLVYAPFPTNIRVGFQGSTILITWQDSPDHSGTYNVYRSTKLPDGSNYKNAEFLGNVPSGIQKFSYRVTDSNLYYYFILPVTDQKQIIEVFIPLQNYTLIPVKIENVSEMPVQSGHATSTQSIKQFKLVQRDTSIVIKFIVSNYRGKVYIYRSQKPFVNTASLIEAVQIKSLEVNQINTESEYQIEDTPFPGIYYYWSVLTESETSSLNFSFIEDKNTSSKSAALPFTNRFNFSASSPRYAPLPVLQSANIFLPSQKTESFNFTEGAQKNINSIVSKHGEKVKNKTTEIMYVHKKILSEAFTEATVLANIAENYFPLNQYTTIITEIDKFLAIPRSKKIKAAAVFYRAQANAMLGNYQEALLDAITAHEVFPVEADSWITFLIRQLKNRE